MTTHATSATTLQPPFRPSVDSLCYPCITTTHLSPIVSYLWNFRHCPFRYYWKEGEQLVHIGTIYSIGIALIYYIDWGSVPSKISRKSCIERSDKIGSILATATGSLDRWRWTEKARERERENNKSYHKLKTHGSQLVNFLGKSSNVAIPFATGWEPHWPSNWKMLQSVVTLRVYSFIDTLNFGIHSRDLKGWNPSCGANIETNVLGFP